MRLAQPATWFRAAAQRLDASRLLWQHSMYIDATYLGGFVVECAIKGLAGLGDRDEAAELLSSGEAVLTWARNNV